MGPKIVPRWSRLRAGSSAAARSYRRGRCPTRGAVVPAAGVVTPRAARVVVAVVLAAATSIAAAAIGEDVTPRRTRLRRVIASIDSLYDTGRVAEAWQRARAVHDSALEVGDRTLAGRALTAGARAVLPLRGPDAALEILDRAERMARAAADSGGWANALGFRSIALAWRGDFSGAAEAASRRLEICRLIGDTLGAGWSHVSLGYAALARGAARKAREHYERAGSLFARAGARRARVTAQIGLGRACVQLAEWSDARRAFRSALVRAGREGDWRQRLDALNNLGALEFRMGDAGRAAEAFEAVRRERLERGDARGALIPAVNVARADAVLGRYAQATAILEEALDTARRRGFGDAIGMIEQVLGDVFAAAGRLEAAADHYRDVLAQRGSSKRQRSAAALGLAGVLLRTGRADSALAEIDRALREGVLAEFPARFEALAARCERLRGRPREALRRARRACALARGQPASTRFDGRIELGLAAARLGRTAVARQAWRCARALADSLHRATRRYDWREVSSRLRRLVDLGVAAMLPASGVVTVPSDTTAHAGVAVRELVEAVIALEGRTLLERAVATDARVADSLLALRPPRLDEVLAVLRPDEMLVDVALGDEDGVVFAASPRGLYAWRVPGTQSDTCERIAMIRAALSRADGPWPEAALGAVVESFFGPGRELLAAARQVILVPDGCLVDLPPSLVAGVVGGGYWAVVPSAMLLAKARRPRAPGAGGGGVVVLRDAGTSLPGADDEVRYLARRFVTREIVRADVAADAVAGAVPGAAPSVIHVAAHYHVDADRPWSSAVVLRGPDGEASRLRAGDVVGLRTPASLVVLAACESARGRVAAGEGVLGIGSAFLVAGARAVVATLWPVDDGATARLCTAFYDALARGRTVAGALDEARCRLRDDPETEHPGCWAGFVVIGDPTLRPAPRRRCAPRLARAAGVVALALALVAAMIRRRHVAEGVD